MDLHIVWFVLWGVLWAVYFMLDGFVLGAGMLHRVLGKTDIDRRVVINSFGPVWDGNEVWLITAGGATFAAFPTTYALMFSYLYTPLLLLLFGLIVRGVSFEFRSKEESAAWRGCWDWAIVLSSFVPALLFGVAFGNIFSGLPMDQAGYHGSLVALLNPYGIVSGLLFVMLFLEHGALYVAVKSTGELSRRAESLARTLWIPLLVVAVAFLGYTNFATKLYDNYLKTPVLLVAPIVAVAALIGVRVLLGKGNTLSAFTASCVTILGVVGTGVIGLFPNLIPSSLDTLYSLTIYNSSSSEYTLRIMTAVAFMFVPVVILYKIWVYRIFRGRVTAEGVAADHEAY
ncbi:cytochrome d ubiquinol oxidase subunit II [Geomonas subterranea]|uniref:Cytochrome d ubiquinol oxidase subunit II n=1 Tax=Geomonas subterranea TaxID=2847989 RepID=A0ABX8LJW3_9BACT|nr:MULTISPECIES: cytochrome d ubiquinol oxidase subunit II [Geomonas]QXE91107.1 cytochrome d ubiquinol oxidase subunit II [Geomonas subterranea]QXM10806.1 cytochrome d ubiquinol oxidase subunit II [Geomonas subterranea]